MADSKTPGGTSPISASPELDNLRERETALKNEIGRLNKMDANKMSGGGHDLAEVKRRANVQLVEIRKAIEEAAK